MRIAKWPRSFMLVGISLLSAGVRNGSAAQTEKPVNVSLCDVLARPKDFSGKTLIMTVRITSTKEGSFLWSPECRKLVLHLEIDASARSQKGISDLYQALKLYGLSDHPVVATLTGVFIYDQYDETRHRRSSVFNASAATDIKQSVKEEHR
jgi:hypothetical protein